MAQDLFDAHSEVRELYDAAADILGFDLARICFDGPEDALRQTNMTQPAIFVHSMALSRFVAEKGLTAAMMAGHSLGEYSALCAAGALTFADGLQLVKVRGELMHKAGEINAGTMAAVIGLDADALNKICEAASARGVVTVANYNSPAQIVISGSITGVERAMEVANEAGAKKVVPLVVGGAFHSPLMEFAISGLSEALAAVQVADPKVPVYSNVTSEPVLKASDVKRLLLEQLTSPVRWVDGINAMIADGAEKLYEIGPGNVLTGLQRRIDRSMRCAPINTLEQLNELDNE